MEASDSLSRIMGIDFFIPFPFPNFGNGFFYSLPVPEFWEWIFFIPFPFPNFGNAFFFIPFPFPNYGNGFFSFPTRSRIVGMDFFHSLPIPKFAISQKGIKTGIGLL